MPSGWIIAMRSNHQPLCHSSSIKFSKFKLQIELGPFSNTSWQLLQELFPFRRWLRDSFLAPSTSNDLALQRNPRQNNNNFTAATGRAVVPFCNLESRCIVVDRKVGCEPVQLAHLASRVERTVALKSLK